MVEWRDGIFILLHKENPVAKLDDKQIIDIYTGKITNWKEVGGKEAPITVVNKAEGARPGAIPSLLQAEGTGHQSKGHHRRQPTGHQDRRGESELHRLRLYWHGRVCRHHERSHQAPFR